MTDPQNFNTVALTTLVSAAGAIVGAYKWFQSEKRKNKVDDTSAVLNVSTMEQARLQLENQANDLQRIREDAAAAMDAAQKRMDAMQLKMDALGTQLDAEISRRRTLEDVNAQLRRQIVGLGAQPVA